MSGIGGVGLNAIQGARLAGAEWIIAVDLGQATLKAARPFAATDLVNGCEVDAIDAIMEITANSGGASVLVGIAAVAARLTFDPVGLTSGAETTIGSRMATPVQTDIPALVPPWREGAPKLDALVARRGVFE
ncbi:MAG: zinc-binding dehydrogenase [Pseudomonadota bacterium]